MAIRWDRVDFRRIRDLRRCPDIRRGVLWDKTVISQYVNAKKILQILQGEETQISPYWDIRDFHDKVFNPYTAEGWGLDCWGCIVAVERTLKMYGSYECFGFDGSGCHPFDCKPFASDEVKTITYKLSDELYRKLIFFKAAINITDGTLASLNKLMNEIYGDQGNVMVIHTGTMKIRFFFDFYLTEEERSLISCEEVPPKPAGVGFDIYEVPIGDTFGFDGSGLQPFDCGTFAALEPRNAYSTNS